MNLPETVTPWLVLISTSIATAAAVGAAWMWLWKRAVWPAFAGAVLDAVTPLLQSMDRLAESITQTNSNVENALAERAVQVDRKFDEIASAQSRLLNRMDRFEARQSKGTERVVAAVTEAVTARDEP